LTWRTILEYLVTILTWYIPGQKLAEKRREGSRTQEIGRGFPNSCRAFIRDCLQVLYSDFAVTGKEKTKLESAVDR
jgi:hypothetical protein